MNVVIKNSPWLSRDLVCLFGDSEVSIIDALDLQTLVTKLGLYPSKSKAMKDGRVGPIPLGFTEFKATKRKTIWIWNPSE